MKDKMQIDKDPALSNLLHAWKVDAQVPPRFQEAVWERIQRSQSHVTVSFWHVLAARLEGALARPRLATAYIVVLLLVGAAAGYLHAEDRAAQASSALRDRYVSMVDPYQMTRN